MIPNIRIYLMVLALSGAMCEYRSFDGSNNNLDHPNYGAHGSTYVRLQAPAAYADGVGAVAGPERPSTMLISNLVFTATNRLIENDLSISDFLPYWGQFLAHDIICTPADANETMTIPVPACASTGACDGIQSNITLKRAKALGTMNGMRAVINEMSSYVDASHVYGDSDFRADLLRQKRTPYLRTQQRGKFMPPVTPETEEFMAGKHPRRFLAGDLRANENPALQSLQTLFLREHNRRADELLAEHPSWDDETVFQEARKMVVAIMQKITYDEYLPTLLGQKLPEYKGYDSKLDPTIDVLFMTASFRYGHSAINPLILRLDESGKQHPNGHLVLRDVFFNPLPVYQAGIEPILRGMLFQPDSEVDTVIIDDLRKFFFDQPFDLVAVNTMRGRDLGVPTYNEARAALGLAPAKKWSDISLNLDVQNRLRQAYRNNISQVDAYVGGLAEEHMPNSMLGPLFHASVKEQFLRSRDGDRFWYQNEDAGLSKAELEEIEQMSLSKLILANTDIEKLPSSVFRVPKPSEFSFSGTMASSGSGSSSGSPVGSVKLNEGLSLSWNASESGVIHFEFASNYSGWFALGFNNNGMINADIITCQPQSSGSDFTCADYYSTSTATPVPDTDMGGQNDITDVQDITAENPWHKRIVRFTRKLVTGDARDKELSLTGAVPIIFAWSNSVAFEYHGANRGSARLTFAATGSSFLSELEESARQASKLYFVFHGALMLFSFGIMMPFAIYVARNPTIFEKWLSHHKNLMKGVVHVAVGDIIVVYISGLLRGISYMAYDHARIGFFLVALMLFNTILGYMAKSLDFFKRENSRIARKVHYYLGWSTYSLGLCNCVIGLRDISLSFDPNYIFSWAFAAISAIMLSFLLYFHKYTTVYVKRLMTKKLNRFSSLMLTNRNLPKFEWEEVHYRVEKGAHWIIINGVIYDVEEFRLHHPGGTEILAYVIGIDATEIYEGTTSLSMLFDSKDQETGRVVKRISLKRYSHSRLASFELGSLAVGYVSNADTSLVINNIIEASDRYIPVKLISKDLVVQSTAKDKVYKMVFAFPNTKWRMCVQPGMAISMRVVFAGKIITRFYTPIHLENQGKLELIVKMYEDGIFTGVLDKIPIEAELYLRGPMSVNEDLVNEHSYDGRWKRLGMVAAGSGVAPMLLLLEHQLKKMQVDSAGRPDCEMHLLIVAHSEADLIAMDMVMDLESRSRGSLKVYVLTTTACKDLPYHVAGRFHGRISREILQKTMPLVNRRNSILSATGVTSAATLRRRLYQNQKKPTDPLHSARGMPEVSAKSIRGNPEIIRSSNIEEDIFGSEPANSDAESDTGPAVKNDSRHNAEEDVIAVVSGRAEFNDSTAVFLQEIGYEVHQIICLANSHQMYRAPSVHSKGSNRSKSGKNAI